MLTTGLHFVEEGKYEITSCVLNSKGYAIDETEPIKGDLKFESYRRKTIEFWMKKLGIREKAF